MKTVGIALTLSFALSVLAACVTQSNASNEVYFSGTHGVSKYFCGPGQRQEHLCY